MFDEPVNGLDPEGIRWIRTLMRSLAAEGRTVFVSSHLMSEMESTADHLIVIGAAASSPTAAWPTSSPAAPAQAVLVRTRSRTPWPGQSSRRVAPRPPPAQARHRRRRAGQPAGARAHRGPGSGHRLRRRDPGAPPRRRPGVTGAGVHELTADSVEYHAQRAGRRPTTERRHDMAAVTTGRATARPVRAQDKRLALRARSARRARDHVGVLDRNDPHVADGDAQARRAVRRQGVCVRRGHPGHRRDQVPGVLTAGLTRATTRWSAGGRSRSGCPRPQCA
jgi:energy-coupling factor transporter ATP-binding protein EcfA2